MLKENDLVDGKYRVRYSVGRGQMGEVWLADHLRLSQLVAIKEVLSTDAKKDDYDIGEKEQDRLAFELLRERLEKESDLLKKLKNDHLPRVLDIIPTEDSILLVMDYIQGRSLQRIMEEDKDKKNGFSEEEIFKYAIQLAEVLKYLHNQSPPIIHRDIKPSNIMLDKEKIYVIDFGTAKEILLDGQDSRALGTAGYAAPEQYKSHNRPGRSDERTDIYNLGATLFHLATGQEPEPLRVGSVLDIKPELSEPLDKIIRKCTEYKPEERYKDVGELLDDLKDPYSLTKEARENAKKAMTMFLVPAVASLVFLGVGMGTGIAASKMGFDTYAEKIQEADWTNDYDEKIILLNEAIETLGQGGREEAYIELIKAYKQNETSIDPSQDPILTQEEESELESCIEQHKNELIESGNYANVCYEMGKANLFHLQYGNGTNETTNMINAYPWFKRVIDNSDSTSENYRVANLYVNIGEFLQTIGTLIKEGEDKGKYQPFFETINELLNTIAVDRDEAEIVRIQLLEFSRGMLQQYTNGFRRDGVELSQMNEMLSLIDDTLEDVQLNK